MIELLPYLLIIIKIKYIIHKSDFLNMLLKTGGMLRDKISFASYI